MEGSVQRSREYLKRCDKENLDPANPEHAEKYQTVIDGIAAAGTLDFEWRKYLGLKDNYLNQDGGRDN